MRSSTLRFHSLASARPKAGPSMDDGLPGPLSSRAEKSHYRQVSVIGSRGLVPRACGSDVIVRPCAQLARGGAFAAGGLVFHPFPCRTPTEPGSRTHARLRNDDPHEPATVPIMPAPLRTAVAS